MAAPDTWGKYCLVSLEVGGGTEIQFGARTEDVDINEGDRQGDTVANCDGAYLWIDRPQEAGTLTLKMRPVSISSTAAAGGLFQPYRGGTYDATDPLDTATSTTGAAELLATYLRGLFRVAVLWTNDTAAVAAAGAVTAGADGLRFWCQYARIVSHQVSFSNKELVITATIKFAPRDTTGVWNYGWQSCTTAAMATLDTTLSAWTATEGA